MPHYTEKKETFMFRKSLDYFGNMMRNYNECCDDTDFFGIVKANFDHDAALELILAAYTREELKEMENARSRSERLDLSDSLDEVFAALWNNESSRGKCREVARAIVEIIKANCPQPESDATEARLNCLRQTLKLDDLETEILTLAYVKSDSNYDWPHRLTVHQVPKYYAMALDRSVEEVRAAMSPQGRLLKFSLLDDDFDFSRRTLGNFMEGSSDVALSRRYYEKQSLDDALPWTYFGETARNDGAVLKRMLAGCDGPCNILFYGAPGTGKTSFAKSLARELGRSVFQIRLADREGDELANSTRMIGIQMCNVQENPEDGLMFVDEADALLRTAGLEQGRGEGDGCRRSEKGVVNTILDEMRMPAIWIVNASPMEMDESVRRRFDYSVRFDRLVASQRAAIWRNQATRCGLEALLPPEKTEELAMKYETSAGGIATILSNLKRMEPAPAEVDSVVESLMKPHCRLMGIRNGGDFLPAKDYSLDGLSIKGAVKLDKLVVAARNFLDGRFNSASTDRPRMNILLFGPPGTGKTEFVKYLGKSLGRKVVAIKGSDLLSPWVGRTEQLIADAFRRAEADKSILFFDEVDSFLQDRSGASHSWEITQVNELLQQMENFSGIMVAATNFAKNLDPATARRFTYKLEFGYLDETGGRRFFERFFKTPLTADEAKALSGIRNLAPGDFRTVRQELFYLGGDVTNTDRIEALRSECSHKKEEKPQSRIGFGA